MELESTDPSGPAVLDEDFVVGAVCTHLAGRGYEIRQRLTTKQRGIDIIAVKAAVTWWVEAKGATSTRRGSPRFGSAFDAAQVFDRVAKGVYTALALRGDPARPPGARIGVAFPQLPAFESQIRRVASALREMEITIFLVDPHGRVTTDERLPSS